MEHYISSKHKEDENMRWEKRHTLTIATALLISVLMLVAGCMPPKSSHYASSTVQYLYPATKEHIETPAIPVLSLPLRVGIAFVPETSEAGVQNPWWRVPAQGSQTSRVNYAAVHSLDEKKKMDLMKKISAEFKQYPFVKSIEIIPSPYLSPGGSFANLDQIRTMYGVDVVALLSYDQVQHTDEGLLSLSYWTVVGVYVFKGEKNDTNTMLDAAVFDVPSRKMLFRAPGLSHIKGSATPVNLSEQLRVDSQRGFDEAAVTLAASLQEQLDLFKEKIKESPQEYKIEHKVGYRGGGSVDLLTLALALAMGGALLWTGNRRNR
jgi:rhombotail lipoprotein